MLAVLVTAGISQAAQDSDLRWNPDQDSTANSSLNSAPVLSPNSTSNQNALGSISDETLLRLLESRRDLKEKEESTVESRGEISGDDKRAGVARRNAARKAQLLVKAEPGDGLVKLSWKLANPKLLVEGQSLRFTIRYGTESEKLTRSLQVGSTDSSVVRDLKNNQPYYIQVVAGDREQLTLYKSDEIRVIPLPAEDQGSRLEKAFSRKTLTLMDKVDLDPFVRDLRQFGYDFFKNSSQLTGSFDTLPAGGDYIIGPGDALQLNLWGSLNARHELTVDRQGEIMIPRVGSVKVWGLTYDQSREVVNKAIGRYFKNYEFSMTLGRLRSIQVYVVGEVEAPGSYPVSSLSTVINALSAAGGPTRNGSLRSIKVTRPGQTPQEVDLYDMFLTGDRSKDARLQNGDTVFVPVIGPVAAVAGEVRRPAIYEIKGAATLPELLKMAGGVTASGYIGRIQVERLANNSARVVLDYEPKDGTLDGALGTIQVQDRDMVKVFPVQGATRQIVSLKGNVLRPGEYQYRKGMRLADLLSGYQELLPESYLESVEITRLAPPDFHRELLTANLRRALAGGEADNILLQEQDSVKVFSRWEMEEKPRVSVNGAVVNPGTYDFFPGMTVRDLITAAGSPKRNAFLETGELSRIVIVGDKANPSRISLDLAKALAGDPQHNLPLQTDDVLIVRSVTDWFDASDKFIKLKGEVRFPGVYSVGRGEKLSSVIARAGGYTERAYLRGAKFIRRSVRETQQKRMDEIVARTEKQVLSKQAALAQLSASREEIDATKSSLENLMKGIELAKTMKAEGRVVIRLAELDELRKSGSDVVVEGGDELEIPVRPSVVLVMGFVYNPISFVYEPQSSDLGSYLKKAGGPTNDADEAEMYVIKADGTVFSRQQSSFGLHWSDDARRWTFGNSFTTSALEPGDALVVPQKIERIAWMREIKDITQILANVALTAGTILIGLK
jgi:protein involved in polysaccharide export with SLBB domain